MIRVIIAMVFFYILFTPMIQAADNAGHRDLLLKHYRLEKPEGDGPFPAVILVSGCSGFQADFQKEFYDNVQSKLVKLGFLTLRVNYLAVRNEVNCQPNVSAEAVAGDISITAEYLQQQPFVKKEAISIMGWSFGASAVLQALGRTYNRDPVKVEGAVAYYPLCDFVQQKWDPQIPVLVLVGDIDNVTPLRKCKFFFSNLPEGHKLTVRIYDNAHHCFDNATLPTEKHYQFGTLGYNETAAASAWKEVTNFLKK